MQERFPALLEVPCGGKVYENHLGAALIQHGGTVICQNEWFYLNN